MNRVACKCETLRNYISEKKGGLLKKNEDKVKNMFGKSGMQMEKECV